ncbi:hypothetical protein E2320_014572, partial [Naja naja]
MLLLEKQLFLLLLLSQFPCATMLVKCPLKLTEEDNKGFHYYKTGDYLITGITSKIFSILYPYDFSKSPTHRLESQVKIILCQLDFQATAMTSRLIKYTERTYKFVGGKVWFATALSDTSVGMFYHAVDLQHKHALFSFLTQTKRRTQYYNYNSYAHTVTQFGKKAFWCSSTRPALSKKVWERCTERISQEFPPHDVVARILSEDGSSISKATQAVASVLSEVSSSQMSKRSVHIGNYQSPQIVQPWQ